MKDKISSLLFTSLNIALLFCQIGLAAPQLLGGAKEPESRELVDIFSTDNPGSGTLVYKQGAKTELVQLGNTTGTYALGIIFKSTDLPEGFQTEFKNTHIIQLVFGTFSSKLQTQVPQFGAISLVSRDIPTETQTFKTVIRGKDSNAVENLGFILFSSPNTPLELSEEDRLKSNFFSRQGYITLLPLLHLRDIAVPGGTSTLNFKSRSVQLEINSQLSSPFSQDAADLQGKIEVPLYWADGKESESFVKKIASHMLSGIAAPPSRPPSPISHHNRSLAGSTRKDATPPSDK